MVEPPNVGFTGVVRDARPTERLARDLTTGRGAAPMAEAGAAWARLAAGFGEAAVEYPQIVAAVRRSWSSANSEAVLDKIGKLEQWLTEAAGAALSNAAKAESQAVAYEVAKLAMPSVAEVVAAQAIKDTVENISIAAGAPLVAVAANAESEEQGTKQRAARVMQSYEAAATQLAVPWEQTKPPVVANSAALDAERAAQQAATSAVAPAAVGGMPMGVVPPMGGFVVPPRVKTEYQARTFAQSVSVPQPVQAVAPVTTEAVAPMPPMMPAAMAPAAAAQDEEHDPRAGAVEPTGADGVRLPEGWLGVVAGVSDSAPASAQADEGLTASPAVLGEAGS